MSSSAAMTTATRRPIPLAARDDLVHERIEFLGVSYQVIKDPVGLKYFRLQPEQHQVLSLLDGERSLEQLRDAVHEVMPTVRLQLSDIQHLISDLHQKGLLFSNRHGQGAALVKQHQEEFRKKALSSIRSLLYVRLPGWDPEPVLQKLYPFVRWIYHPVAVAAAAVLLVSSWILLAVQFSTFASQLPEFQQFFSWPNLLYLWATLGVCKIIHEFGHGMTCKHFGGECHGMGIMLLVFSPCLYCDVSDSWMLKSKWKRIAIGAAGMYIEVVISAIAIFVWWNTEPGLVHHLCLNIFFVTAITTVLWNANPLMRFDGYYMMSDLLEIPNLRPKADRLLREQFAWHCLGIEAHPDPFMPESGRTWFAMFAVSAGIYRWFILAAITIFLYTVLKPYGLQSIGITLAVVSISMIFFNLGLNIYRIVSAPRIEPLSRPKIVVSLVVVTGLVVGALAVPLPLHVESMFLIEPHDVRHIYTLAPGRIDTLPVQPGKRVESGQELARLHDPDLELEGQRLDHELRLQELRIRIARALDDPVREKLAIAQHQVVLRQREKFEDQLAQLIVTAGVSGRVVAPPRIPEPSLDVDHEQLGAWYGTPLEDRNLGCTLPERTHLLSIAPDEYYQAVVLFDQGDRNDLVSAEEYLGMTVEAADGVLRVRSVLSGQAADRARIVAGDQVTSCNQAPVKTLVNIIAAIGDTTKGADVQLGIIRDGKSQEVTLSPDVTLTAVELKFEHLPHRVYPGFVEAISHRELNYVPELLSNKLGGQLPTISQSGGRERLVSPAYQATVMLEQDSLLMKTGLRGQARFLVDTRTTWQWTWRYLRRTFKFRL